MCFVILCRKGLKICYPFVHLFCLKDKKQVNQIVYFYVNVLPKVVGFVRVLRLVLTRNVDRVVRIIKI